MIFIFLISVSFFSSQICVFFHSLFFLNLSSFLFGVLFLFDWLKLLQWHNNDINIIENICISYFSFWHIFYFQFKTISYRDGMVSGTYDARSSGSWHTADHKSTLYNHIGVFVGAASHSGTLLWLSGGREGRVLDKNKYFERYFNQSLPSIFNTRIM